MIFMYHVVLNLYINEWQFFLEINSSPKCKEKLRRPRRCCNVQSHLSKRSPNHWETFVGEEEKRKIADNHYACIDIPNSSRWKPVVFFRLSVLRPVYPPSFILLLLNINGGHCRGLQCVCVCGGGGLQVKVCPIPTAGS